MKKFSITKWIIALVLGIMLSAGIKADNTAFASYSAYGGNYPGAWDQTDEGMKYRFYNSKGETWYAEDEFVRTGAGKYYVNEYGIMQTGWIKKYSSWYYADSSGKIQTGWKTIGGTTYYFYSDGEMAVNTVIDREWRVDKNGAYVGVVGEWKTDGMYWRYVKHDGTLIRNQTAYIGKDYYAFNIDGYLIAGWIEIENTDDWMYADSEGRIMKGWQKIDGTWYYFGEYGLMARDTIVDGIYELNSDGELTGRQGRWIKDASGWWFQNPDGTYPKGCTATIDDQVYYFDKNGYMETGWIDISEYYDYYETTVWYYVNADGSFPEVGWQMIDGTWYYFPYNDGYLAQGGVWAGYQFAADGSYTPIAEKDKLPGTWKSDSKGWWYEFADGSFLANGTTEIDGVGYAFGNDGYMLTGWVNDNNYYDWSGQKNHWYHFEADGSASTGWKYLDGNWYYFGLYGHMYHDEYVDGYYLGHDGAMVDNPQYVDYYYHYEY